MALCMPAKHGSGEAAWYAGGLHHMSSSHGCLGCLFQGVVRQLIEGAASHACLAWSLQILGVDGCYEWLLNVGAWSVV